MAEIVEYRVGKTLGEIDVLIKFGMLDEAESKEIVRSREEFEYKLRRRTNDKLTYLNYIKFELNLMQSIENYQKTIGKKTEEDEIFKLQAKKLEQIVKSRTGHISFLYRKLIMRHQFDKRLWIAYIEFAKQRKLLTRVSSLYWRLLRVVSMEESLWVDASDFELNITQDQNTARKLLILGLRHLPNSKLIKQKLKTICDVPSLEGQDVADEDVRFIAPATSEIAPAPNRKSMMDLLYERYDCEGINEARKLYSTLERNLKNQTLSLYVGMIQVETWQLTTDKSNVQLDRIRSIYDKSLMKFGQNKTKLWYEYLQFELKFAKTLEDFERINRLYTRAQATLHPSKVDLVIERYTLMQVKARSRVDVEYSDYSDLED